MAERLQKILAQWGVASRRQAEQMIQAGRVQVNGAIAHLGQKADPEQDAIAVDGRLIQAQQRPDHLYLLLNKPAGIVCTCTDPWGRPTILDLLPPAYRQAQGLHPVGRLDQDSTGALLITNDGELTYYLTHPRHHIAKTYRVWVAGHPPKTVLQQWRQGVVLEGRPTLPAQVQVLERQSGAQPQTCLEIVLHEGRNRQIRRVAEQLGYPVVHLHRTGIGPVQLQSPTEPELLPGQFRPLQATELDDLRQVTEILVRSRNDAS